MTKNEKRIFLESIKDILDDAGIEFWLESGTLLGAIRDKDFIEDDKDIDISVKRENQSDITKLVREFKKMGDVSYRVVQTPHGQFINGHHVIKDGFKMDIYYWWKIKDGYLAYTNPESVSINKAKHYDTLDTIDFLGMKVKVPHNPEEYLTGVYGDWRTPNENWKEDFQKNLRPLDKYDKYFY